ncbi:MAG: 2-amino-4-hydroxy-6-hydroxymethyldihydropteridine diphosphokinase [Deltaproteobacteria bacterium]|nr:2-amino-4-hydroxy-6-hydroxymethyldihydropteridine diphosphokinase [Deltaproteobacteria bacterium]MBW2305463.1 2-amino-4-hydroxy-6-hydroxymethyldihydropteridine diphosphokinase [Deltaproteobacteria bacterium]
MKKLAYIGIGANLGERESNCRKALVLLDGAEGVRIVASSPLYWTEPVGVESIEWFVNGAAALETPLSPESLLALLLRIEAEMGRDRSRHGAPRTIDLDLLFYNNTVKKSPGLIVPHPRIQERRFVLAPLHDIAPNYVHPILHQTVAQLLEQCPDNKTVQLLKD